MSGPIYVINNLTVVDESMISILVIYATYGYCSWHIGRTTSSMIVYAITMRGEYKIVLEVID